ncbi:SDR family NAD(P)-dependent oxidoreductase [Sphingomonas sp. NBWT7]|uniref:SDR family NAD(P)-dependent oxidoreductase n=1 Tax=Sphingomonas sp. NBWT7 TaxID=2596913 RepID=UPI00215651B0|nr:SDR family NAD(P)-dependent oxidoreductase [Sphingomonas sp. NBWT7]
MAEAFGGEGMNIMIADIEGEAARTKVEELRARQIRAEWVEVDVTSRDSVRRGALETVAKFGKVHLVANNAGIGAGGPLGSVPEGDWDWVLDVNLKGVVYGVEVFAPLMESHGEGGHFVNTASMAGLISPAGMEPYCASKFAVVAMSEGWRQQLAPRNIGVSILCPGLVSTNIYAGRRNRQNAVYGEGGKDFGEAEIDQRRAWMAGGIDPRVVGQRVVEAVRDNDLYVLTHVEYEATVRERFERIMAGFDKSKHSPALGALPAERRLDVVQIEV